MSNIVYIVQKKDQHPEKHKLNNLSGFLLLGVQNKLIISGILTATKDIVTAIQVVKCGARNSHQSAGVILINLFLPNLIMKCLYGVTPPFLRAQIVACFVLLIIGCLLIGYLNSGNFLILSLLTISYAFGIRDQLCTQFVGYYENACFQTWTLSSAASEACGSLLFFVLSHGFTGINSTFLFYIPFGICDILAFCVILKHPITVVVLPLEATTKELYLKKTPDVDSWPPAPINAQLQQIKIMWCILLCAAYMSLLRYIEIQGLYENVTLQSGLESYSFRLLSVVHHGGYFIGRYLVLFCQSKLIFVAAIILETTIVVLFLYCFIVKFLNCWNFSILALLSGISYGCSFSYILLYLSKNVCCKYPNVTAASVLNLVEACFALIAGILQYGYYRLHCSFS